MIDLLEAEATCEYVHNTSYGDDHIGVGLKPTRARQWEAYPPSISSTEPEKWIIKPGIMEWNHVG